MTHPQIVLDSILVKTTPRMVSWPKRKFLLEGSSLHYKPFTLNPVLSLFHLKNKQQIYSFDLIFPSAYSLISLLFIINKVTFIPVSPGHIYFTPAVWFTVCSRLNSFFKNEALLLIVSSKYVGRGVIELSLCTLNIYLGRSSSKWTTCTANNFTVTLGSISSTQWKPPLCSDTFVIQCNYHLASGATGRLLVKTKMLRQEQMGIINSFLTQDRLPPCRPDAPASSFIDRAMNYKKHKTARSPDGSVGEKCEKS